MLNRFLTSKQSLMESGEITQRTFNDYYSTCQNLANSLGLGLALCDLSPEDFERTRSSWAKRFGPVALGNEIQRARCVFKFALDCGLIDCPVKYGSTFKRPSRRILRQARVAKGPRMFAAE